MGWTTGLAETPEISQTMQSARSAFSQIATYFFEGLTVIDEMPSDPSTPARFSQYIMNTWYVDLVFLINVVDDNVVTSWVEYSLIVQIE